MDHAYDERPQWQPWCVAVLVGRQPVVVLAGMPVQMKVRDVAAVAVDVNVDALTGQPPQYINSQQHQHYTYAELKRLSHALGNGFSKDQYNGADQQQHERVADT